MCGLWFDRSGLCNSEIQIQFRLRQKQIKNHLAHPIEIDVASNLAHHQLISESACM